MRRTFLIVTAVVATLAAAFGAWWWWTRPPSAPTATLLRAAVAPADADGLIVLASPVDAARWLARHVQALALVAVAAPDAVDEIDRLRPVLAALGADARGPLTLWWTDRRIAARAAVGSRDAPALRQVAALGGVAWREEDGEGGLNIVTVGSSAEMVNAPAGGTVPPVPEEAKLAALARVGARWWRVVATRTSLQARSGAPPRLPSEPTRSSISTSDLGALLAPMMPAGVHWHAPATVAFARQEGWAVDLPEAHLPAELRVLLRLRGSSTVDGATRWKGALGEVWSRPGPGVILASSPAMLSALAAAAVPPEEGTVTGADLAWAAARLAHAASVLPVLRRHKTALESAARRIEGLRTVRWKLAGEGGCVTMEW